MSLKNHHIKKKIFWIIVPLIFIVACSKNPFIDNGKNIVGEWKYEKVKKKEKYTLHSSDITVFYQNLILNLRSDNTFVIYRENGGNRATGTWLADYYIEYSGTDDEDVYYYYIEGSLTEVDNDKTYSFYWEDLNVTSKVIRFTEELDNYIYKYKLIKY